MYFFNRKLSQLLLLPETIINLSTDYAIDIEGYSEYCQKILGIQASIQEEEYIEIDPQIMYGNP